MIGSYIVGQRRLVAHTTIVDVVLVPSTCSFYKHKNEPQHNIIIIIVVGVVVGGINDRIESVVRCNYEQSRFDTTGDDVHRTKSILFGCADQYNVP
jgi:hypothetical protein